MQPHEGKRKNESLWAIFRIHHQRSRYLYEMFYKKHEITREVYDYCLREGYGDANLIAKWKKQGYERLCCLRCIQTKDHNFGTTCICRVPKSKLETGKLIECQHCGCRGCASGDGSAVYVTPGAPAMAMTPEEEAEEAELNARAAALKATLAPPAHAGAGAPG
jgi:bud site selection protein 31